MKNLKFPKANAANDNRHDPFLWELVYTYLDRWFDKNHLPAKNFNQALHYAYEIKNRPWLDDEITTDDLANWLWDQKQVWQKS